MNCFRLTFLRHLFFTLRFRDHQNPEMNFSFVSFNLENYNKITDYKLQKLGSFIICNLKSHRFSILAADNYGRFAFDDSVRRSDGF